MISVVTAPTGRLVSLDEMLAWLRLDCATESELIEALILAAQGICENKSKRTFLTTTFRQAVSRPYGPIVLQRSPFIEVSSVVDGDGNPVTYDIDSTGARALLTPNTNPDILVVTYSAGYGTESDLVPSCARTAVKVAAAHYWRFRGDDDKSATLPPAVDALLDPIRLV